MHYTSVRLKAILFPPCDIRSSDTVSIKDIFFFPYYLYDRNILNFFFYPAMIKRMFTLLDGKLAKSPNKPCYLNMRLTYNMWLCFQYLHNPWLLDAMCHRKCMPRKHLHKKMFAKLTSCVSESNEWQIHLH